MLARWKIRDRVCQDCEGSGMKLWADCPYCQGTGTRGDPLGLAYVVMGLIVLYILSYLVLR